jgi:hypothetical protein
MYKCMNSYCIVIFFRPRAAPRRAVAWRRACYARASRKAVSSLLRSFAMEDSAALDVLSALGALRKDSEAAAKAKEAAHADTAAAGKSLKDKARIAQTLAEQASVLTQRTCTEKERQAEELKRLGSTQQIFYEATAIFSATLLASMEGRDKFVAAGELFRSAARSFRAAIRSEVYDQSESQANIRALGVEESVKRGLINSLGMQLCQSEAETMVLEEKKASKAETLEEAKKELRTIQAQRTKADESAGVLNGKVKVQKRTNDEIAAALSACKAENGDVCTLNRCASPCFVHITFRFDAAAKLREAITAARQPIDAAAVRPVHPRPLSPPFPEPKALGGPGPIVIAPSSKVGPKIYLA